MKNSSGIKPIAGYLIIKPDGGEKKTPGGIIVLDDAAEKERYGANSGVVLAAADDVKFGLQVGQHVLFGRYAGTMVKGVDGEEYRLCLDEDVKGIYDAAPALAVAA